MKPVSLLLLSLVLLAGCKEEVAKGPTRQQIAHKKMVTNLRSAATALEYREILAAVPGASDFASYDVEDAAKRLAVMEQRAEQAGMSGKEIDAEVAAGQAAGRANAEKTLEERAAAKSAAAESAAKAAEEGEKPAEDKADNDAGDDGKVE